MQHRLLPSYVVCVCVCVCVGGGFFVGLERKEERESMTI